MKCRMIVPTKGINPDYDRSEAERARREGVKYDQAQFIEKPVGHVQEHPDCWLHCVRGFMNSEPIAVPEDEECRNRVREWLGKRESRLKRLALILKSTPSSKKGREFYESMRKAYADELAAIDSDYEPTGDDDAELYEEEEND